MKKCTAHNSQKTGTSGRLNKHKPHIIIRNEQRHASQTALLNSILGNKSTDYEKDSQLPMHVAQRSDLCRTPNNWVFLVL